MKQALAIAGKEAMRLAMICGHRHLLMGLLRAEGIRVGP